ncbi:uncharacterized protein LOC106172343 [Lingula anatina]|uniref:Uncharacterized protein LOC106172343 n=1 Tax=Lingula anatina TaxID=7574 RepID=A0A1S3JDF7_LINAN|nr:uncharacterized protein LOC106172343 [Lingula anatina]|eukprot:XP_013408450.1 uncharacterized protein LOC106172343 [Lingula anatina]
MYFHRFPSVDSHTIGVLHGQIPSAVARKELQQRQDPDEEADPPNKTYETPGHEPTPQIIDTSTADVIESAGQEKLHFKFDQKSIAGSNGNQVEGGHVDNFPTKECSTEAKLLSIGASEDISSGEEDSCRSEMSLLSTASEICETSSSSDSSSESEESESLTTVSMLSLPIPDASDNKALFGQTDSFHADEMGEITTAVLASTSKVTLSAFSGLEDTFMTNGKLEEQIPALHQSTTDDSLVSLSSSASTTTVDGSNSAASYSSSFDSISERSLQTPGISFSAVTLETPQTCEKEPVAGPSETSVAEEIGSHTSLHRESLSTTTLCGSEYAPRPNSNSSDSSIPEDFEPFSCLSEVSLSSTPYGPKSPSDIKPVIGYSTSEHSIMEEIVGAIEELAEAVSTMASKDLGSDSEESIPEDLSAFSCLSAMSNPKDAAGPRPDIEYSTSEHSIMEEIFGEYEKPITYKESLSPDPVTNGRRSKQSTTSGKVLANFSCLSEVSLCSNDADPSDMRPGITYSISEYSIMEDIVGVSEKNRDSVSSDSIKAERGSNSDVNDISDVTYSISETSILEEIVRVVENSEDAVSNAAFNMDQQLQGKLSPDETNSLSSVSVMIPTPSPSNLQQKQGSATSENSRSGAAAPTPSVVGNGHDSQDSGLGSRPTTACRTRKTSSDFVMPQPYKTGTKPYRHRSREQAVSVHVYEHNTARSDEGEKSPKVPSAGKRTRPTAAHHRRRRKTTAEHKLVGKTQNTSQLDQNVWDKYSEFNENSYEYESDFED